MRKKLNVGVYLLFLIGFLCSAFSVQVAAEYSINISIPSKEQACVIPPGKDFYVLGDLYGVNTKDNLTLTVDLLTLKGDAVRSFRSTSFHKPENTNVNYKFLSYYAGTDRRPLYSSLMPDLVYDRNNPDTFKDAWRKICFDTHHFAVLVSGGAYNRDLNLNSERGNSWKILPEGEYKIVVKLLKDGSEVAKNVKNIKIGVSKDIACFRFSPANHYRQIEKYAKRNGIKILSDPLVGFWHPADNFSEFHNSSLFAEILPKWRWNDLTEYQNNHIHLFDYNISETSATYQVEIGTAQKQGIIENNDRFTSYYYSYGEPQIEGAKSAEILKFNRDEFLALTRLDLNSDGNDNMLEPSKLKKSTSILSPKENEIISVGRKFAITGLVKPIQNVQFSIISNSDNTFDFKHRLSAVRYIISKGNQKEIIIKNIGLTRVLEGRKRQSILEFEHEFKLDSKWRGNVELRAEALDETGKTYHSRPVKLKLQIA